MPFIKFSRSLRSRISLETKTITKRTVNKYCVNLNHNITTSFHNLFSYQEEAGVTLSKGECAELYSPSILSVFVD